MLIKKNRDEIENYLVDASNFKGNCDAVFFPEDISEIPGILLEANKKGTPVTIAGNGTGLTGARVPEGGIVIATDRLNKILKINSKQMYAVVEPAVILADFQNILKEKHLMYPPDPTEKNCYIGGTVATNASGEKTFKYGPTRDYVLELEVILPNGELLKLKRGKIKAKDYDLELITEHDKKIKIKIPDYKMPKTKNASGYFCKKNMDAIDLFIGSEGTLGVITKIKVKLVPLPEKIISCLVFFYDDKNALSFIQDARNVSFNTRLREDPRCIEALALEFFDENALNFLANDYPQIPSYAKAGVWFEQEVTSKNEDFFFECWIDLINEFKGDDESTWLAVTDSDNKKIQGFRHAISVKVNEYMSGRNFKKLGTDVAVPDDKFEEFYFYCKKLVEKNSIDYVNYGHFGNSHMHLNMLPKNEKENDICKNTYHIICLKAIELGGTISAEHGIGKLKTNYLADMYGKENIDKMFQLKKTLDPNLILGRGNIFGSSI